MEPEPGDDYIRRIASFIRNNEQGLAAAVLAPRRRVSSKNATDTSIFNPLGWFTSDSAAPPPTKPVVLAFDHHHLFYLLIRLEALGIDVGSLDVRVHNPSRPMNYVNLFPNADRSDALSFVSLRSSLSVVSRLSLGAGWWGRPPPPNADAELKYIYSCFTKLPALSLHAPEATLIAELVNDSPNENALPLKAFKNLQTLECLDLDPRTLLGWDRLAESLRSLTVKRSGLEDVTDIFINAVEDDLTRSSGNVGSPEARHKRAPSRQSSFHSTPLPKSVPEDTEDATVVPSIEDTPRPSETQPLSSLKWAFLRHLSLADNALTFLPTAPLSYLTSVTHLDLSSNLLVSVPSGLSSLYSLTSLNLSDNMIDSVLGIYTMLGQVLSLNLSRNRLESICGLERLLALERVDLRHNLIEESAEVGRLATLPNIAEVWIEGNPLAEMEEGYRIRCFEYFWKEGKNITIDGSSPGFYEKRYMATPAPDQMTSSRPASVALSPPVVAISPHLKSATSPADTPSPSLPPSQSASPHIAPVGHGRRRRNKRIVDLDGGKDGGKEASEANSSRSASHARAQLNAAQPTTGPHSTKLAHAPPQATSATGASTPSIADKPAPAPAKPAFKSRHSRHMTELAPSLVYPDDTPLSSSSLRKNSTMSRSTLRRARVSASVYEPGESDTGQQKEAEAFRARIEALRSDMGEGWLKVFNQSHMGSSGVTSG